MHLLLTAILYTVTIAIGLLLVTAIVKLCVDRAGGKPIPPNVWSALLQIAFFFAGGVILIVTHGHGEKIIPILMMAGAAVALPRLWKAAKAEWNK